MHSDIWLYTNQKYMRGIWYKSDDQKLTYQFLPDENELYDDYDQYYDDGICKTVSDSGSQLNKKCKFPFTFQGIKYNTCISGSIREKPWCPTKLDGNGLYISGKWGYCDTSLCPLGNQNRICNFWLNVR